MTLLYGTINASQIELSADGLSMQDLIPSRPKGEKLKYPGRMTLQKIFEVGRFAVAQHGTNRIGRRSFANIIDEWKSRGVPESVAEAAQHLRDYMLSAAGVAGESRKLEGGFWVAGFSAGSVDPECHRVHFPLGQVERVKRTRFADGDGKHFLEDHMMSFDHAQTRRLAEDEQARSRKPSEYIFGGHTHKVTITTDGPTWDARPKSGTLGCEQLLPLLDALPDIVPSANPGEIIEFDMKRLKDAYFSRATTPRGRKRGHCVRTLCGFEEHRDWPPDQRFYQLIAIGNEAEYAKSDISVADARLYRAHVEDLLQADK